MTEVDGHAHPARARPLIAGRSSISCFNFTRLFTGFEERFLDERDTGRGVYWWWWTAFRHGGVGRHCRRPGEEMEVEVELGAGREAEAELRGCAGGGLWAQSCRLQAAGNMEYGEWIRREAGKGVGNTESWRVPARVLQEVSGVEEEEVQRGNPCQTGTTKRLLHKRRRRITLGR
jgi:hypothetical protein